MAIRFTVTTRPSRIECVCAGDFAMDEALALVRGAFEAAAAQGRSAILIDAREVAGDLTVAQRHEFGAGVAAIQQERETFRGIRCAMVGHQPLVEPNRLAQLVARNRGSDLLVAEAPEQALAWLDGRPE
jgi:hypothetical protein